MCDRRGRRRELHRDEVCVSKALNGKVIRVVEFGTEYGYEVLYINGQAFSGSAGSGFVVDSLTALVVDDNGICSNPNSR